MTPARQQELRLFGPPDTLQPQDVERLGKQQRAVQELMQDGRWRTLTEISMALRIPEASASARLRTMRQLGFTVDRARTFPGSAQWKYRVVP